MSGAVVLTGAPGAGKSATLQALAALLARSGVPFGAIEAEQLAWGSPRLSVAQAARQLAAVLAIQRRAGRRLFVVAAGMETEAELAAIAAAVDAERLLIIGLAARPETLSARLRRREASEQRGDESIVARARALALTAPALAGIDRVVDTDSRTAAELASEILGEMRSRGLVAGAGP